MSILPSPQSDAEFWRIHAGTLAERIETLFDAIAHGDEEHRAWLKEAIDAHILAQPIPPVRGRGTKEARIAELERQLALAAGAGTAETNEDLAQPEGRQSGGRKPVTPNSSSPSHIPLMNKDEAR